MDMPLERLMKGKFFKADGGKLSTFISLPTGNTNKNRNEGEIQMSNHQSSEQEKNIEKMKEIVDEKKQESSQEQDFNQEEQKNQSIKDNEHVPDENNILIDTKNNRMP
ncbi:hypothetical protein [Planococcus halotolerans]|nr:hypothetical protein [Planococcus halotolerans]QHJ72233.1 hypothetical protein DNR44_017210 [Planococcus halotolerans]